MSDGPVMYFDNDADLSALNGKKIAIIGYGIQGEAQALCLRDSGLEVIVSELAGTPKRMEANFVCGPKSVPIRFKMH